MGLLNCPAGDDVQVIHRDFAAESIGEPTPDGALSAGMEALYPNADLSLFETTYQDSQSERLLYLRLLPGEASPRALIAVNLSRTGSGGWQLDGLVACTSEIANVAA
jgi:hypothetical protein